MQVIEDNFGQPLPCSPMQPACGPAAKTAPPDDVVHHPGSSPASLQSTRGQQAIKQGGCPLLNLDAVRGLVRVVCLLIDEAEPIHLQHQEPDEMVVQMTSIEDLRWAVIAAEKELRRLPQPPPPPAHKPDAMGFDDSAGPSGV